MVSTNSRCLAIDASALHSAAPPAAATCGSSAQPTGQVGDSSDATKLSGRCVQSGVGGLHPWLPALAASESRTRVTADAAALAVSTALMTTESPIREIELTT